jgi:hypothetical protein
LKISVVTKQPRVILDDGRKVSLKTVHGNYIVANKDETLCLEAHPLDYSRFTLHQSHDWWYFESFHGTWICASEDKNHVSLIPKQKSPLEAFRIVVLGNLRYAFMSSHGTFLSASKEGLITQQKECKEWETFQFDP